MIGLWLGVVVAQADELDLQPLGQPVQGDDWVCPEHRPLCTRQDRVWSLPGVWTATLDDAERVVSLTFSVFWTESALPIEGTSAVRSSDPWAEARTAFQRVEAQHAGWAVSARTSGDPSLVVYERDEERRSVSAWTTSLSTDDGRTFRSASLHLQRLSTGQR
jgi:hypothetical protein